MTDFNRTDFPAKLETAEHYAQAGEFLRAEYDRRMQDIVPMMRELEAMGTADDDETMERAREISNEIARITGEMQLGEIGDFVKEVIELESKLLAAGELAHE